jgi:hypothetical protein
LTLVACGKLSRDAVMAYFSGLFHKLDRTPSHVWNALVNYSADLCPKEVVEDIRRAYEEELVEPGFVAWEDIERALAAGKEGAMEELKHRYPLITDVVKQIGWWDCFRKDAGRARRFDAIFGSLSARLQRQEPARQAQPRVGRNDPCPCGSGKKFKKCCGR